MKSPRYTAGVVSDLQKIPGSLRNPMEKEGYYVDPEDKKELLDLFDRGDLLRATMKSNKWQRYGCLKRKAGVP